MRRLLPLAAIAAFASLLTGCDSSGTTLESLAGTPAAVHIVEDVEAMAHACAQPSRANRQAGVKAYTDLAEITAIHPKATFGPEGTDVTMRQLLRRTVERTGHCIGVSVDAMGEFHITG
ncbi:MAG TPA: hypothetical protein VN522_09795 [Solirubrobacterales bacterium]|nr:hypothetical protein [Solirubrobacterales bacterium]